MVLSMTLKADITTIAVIHSKSSGVTIEIDPEIPWDAHGLLLLGEALKDIADLLKISKGGTP